MSVYIYVYLGRQMHTLITKTKEDSDDDNFYDDDVSSAFCTSVLMDEYI